MASLTVTLSDEMASIAEAKGLLTASALEAYVRGHISGDAGETEYPPGFDPCLKGAVNPAAFRRGQVLGDIISPIEAKWEAAQ